MTAEFAVAVPAVLLVLAACLGGLRLGTERLRVVDAAAQSARLAALGEPPDAPAAAVGAVVVADGQERRDRVRRAAAGGAAARAAVAGRGDVLRARGRPAVRTEEGAGHVLAVALVAVVVAAFLLAAAVRSCSTAHRRVVAAADAAALAGADVALGDATGGRASGRPRWRRRRASGWTAARSGATLVRVRLSTVVLGVALGAEAVAGPPPPR